MDEYMQSEFSQRLNPRLQCKVLMQLIYLPMSVTRDGDRVATKGFVGKAELSLLFGSVGLRKVDQVNGPTREERTGHYVIAVWQ